MDTISYTALRNQLAGVLDRVNDNHKPVMITRQNGKPAVLISLEDFHAYEEMSYLMASPKNLQRLNEAITQVDEGDVQVHGIIEG
jgi:antitoxin YefM